MTLVVLLSDHESPVRADLQRFYGVNIDEAWGNLSPKHLACLVAELPPGAQTWRAVGGSLSWTDDMFLLASIDHGTRVLAWQKSKNGESNTNPPKMIEPPSSKYGQRSADDKLEQKMRKHIERENRRAELAGRETVQEGE